MKKPTSALFLFVPFRVFCGGSSQHIAPCRGNINMEIMKSRKGPILRLAPSLRLCGFDYGSRGEAEKSGTRFPPKALRRCLSEELALRREGASKPSLRSVSRLASRPAFHSFHVMEIILSIFHLCLKTFKLLRDIEVVQIGQTVNFCPIHGRIL